MAEARGLAGMSPRGFAMPAGHGLDSLAAAASAEGRAGAAAMVPAGADAAALLRHESPVGPPTVRMDVRAAAQRIAEQPVPVSRPDLWGLLTAVSDKARRRPQGAHIMLYGIEHVLGRVVKEVSCSFDSPNVSGRHCRIVRKVVGLNGTTKALERGYNLGPGERIVVMIRDSSSNGTYVNHLRLKRDGPEEYLKHGDLISLVGPPELENAFAFVYRDIAVSNPPDPNDLPRQGVKRKGLPGNNEQIEEGNTWDGKRMKSLLIGGPDGPVSLDDVRRLQRSNQELREQLEEHVATIERLRADYRAAESRHEAELTEAKASITSKFAGDIERNLTELENKKNELGNLTATSLHQQSVIEDLNQRLLAASQSRQDAEELILSQKATITDLEKRVEEERELRKEENAEAQAALKAAVEKARKEAAEERKQQAEAAAKLQKQLEDKISELQEMDKENRRGNDNLRSKLEKEREALVNSEEKVRRLEAQLQEERNIAEAARKRAADREQDLENIRKDLDDQKKARQVATVKASSLELEMETAIRELALEKRKLQGARERIVLRETQLRAFHSTAAEIAALQQKQQDQLKGMLRTLEDGECEDEGRSRGQVDVKRRSQDSELNKPAVAVDGVPLNNEDFAERDELETAASPELAATQGANQENETMSPCSPGNAREQNHNVQRSEKVDVHQGETQQDWVDGETEEEHCFVVADSEESDTSMAGDLDVVPDTLIDDEDSKEGLGAAKFASEAVTSQAVEGASVEASSDTFKSEEPVENPATVKITPPRFTFRSLATGGRAGGAVSTSPICPNSLGTEELEKRSRGNADASSTPRGPDTAPGETMLVDEYVSPKAFSYWGRTQVVTKAEDVGQEDPKTAGTPASKKDTYEGQVPASLRESTTKDPVSDFRDGREFTGTLPASLTAGSPHQKRDSSPCMERRQLTGDLLASEVAGSWAVSSPSSERSGYESPKLNRNGSCDLVETDYRDDVGEEQDAVVVASSQVGTSDVGCARPAASPSQLQPSMEHLPDASASQTTLAARVRPAPYYQSGSEALALNEMLNIVAPELTKLHGLAAVEEDAPDSEGSTDDDADEEAFGQ